MRRATNGSEKQRRPAQRVRHALLALTLVILAGSTVVDRMDVWDPPPVGGPTQVEVELVTSGPPARRGKAPGFSEKRL